MKKLNKIALAVISTAFASQMAFADVVTLKQMADEGTEGAEFRLGIVAKVLGTVELDLINDGFTEVLVEEGDVELQSFAFGQKDIAAAATIESEKYSINSNAGAAGIDAAGKTALLQSEVCVSAEPESIQRLTSYASGEGVGSCAVSSDEVIRKVTATFHADYAVRAAGGLQASLTVDSTENGVDADYSTANAAAAFISAEVIEAGLIDLDGASVGLGGDMDNAATGTLSYSLEFDIAGALSVPESRAVFSHLLQVL